jgi:ParB/Sulfiredoxin domain
LPDECRMPADAGLSVSRRGTSLFLLADVPEPTRTSCAIYRLSKGRSMRCGRIIATRGPTRKKQIRQIANSIMAVGFTAPVLVDEDRVLLAGHGRLEAAKLLGLKTIPAIVLTGLSEARKRALLLADNRIAQSAGWDASVWRASCRACPTCWLPTDLTSPLPPPSAKGVDCCDYWAACASTSVLVPDLARQGWRPCLRRSCTPR